MTALYLGSTQVTLPGAGGGGDGTPYLCTTDVSAAVTVTADSTPHTKGAWTELIASTSVDGTALRVNINTVGTSNVDTSTLIDFAIGAASSEVAFASNIGIGSASTFFEFTVPFDIPAGSRISARTQAAVASDTAIVWGSVLTDGPFATVPTSLTTIGVDTGTSDGVQVAETGWTEIIASTAADYRALIAIPSYGLSTMAFNTADFIRVAKGAAAAEVEIGNGFTYIANSEAMNSAGFWLPGLPAGTRLSGKRDTKPGFITLIGVT